MSTICNDTSSSSRFLKVFSVAKMCTAPSIFMKESHSSGTDSRRWMQRTVARFSSSSYGKRTSSVSSAFSTESSMLSSTSVFSNRRNDDMHTVCTSFFWLKRSMHAIRRSMCCTIHRKYAGMCGTPPPAPRRCPRTCRSRPPRSSAGSPPSAARRPGPRGSSSRSPAASSR